MRRLRIITSSAELPALRALWEELGKQRPATMFQSYAWNSVAASVFEARERPFVIALESDSAAVIVPAALTGRTSATFLGEMLFDYRDILVVADTPADREALVTEALAELGRAAYQLSLTALRHESVLRAALP